MSNASGAEATQEAARERTQEEQRKRSLLTGILDTYLLTYASKDYEVVAQYAYKMADAMIAERKKPNA